MAELRLDISISLDGYVAGPDPSEENPLGIGGEQLHEWALPLEAWRRPHGLEGGEVNRSSEVMEETQANLGATVMGRNMFGGEGSWDAKPWEGWWGDEPPFHMPVFVITHHDREPLVKDGGTTFTFVTDGIESAFAQAEEAAGGKDIGLAGGADVAQQFLRAEARRRDAAARRAGAPRRRHAAARQPRGREPRARVHSRACRPGCDPPEVPGREVTGRYAYGPGC